MRVMQTWRAATGRRRGVAIIYAVFGAFVAASMVSVMLTMASVTHRGAGVKQAKLQATYLAEGAIEGAKKDVQEAIAIWKEPQAEGEATIGEDVIPYTIQPTGLSKTVTDASGIQTIVTGYELQSTATVEGARHLAHRIINAEATPIFQFAVFYTNDLEILPGPNMTLGGRVHTNQDMYLGCGNTLTMDTNYVRSGGGIYRRRKNNTNSSGTVEVRKWVEDPFDGSITPEFQDMYSRSQMTSFGVTTSSGYDSDFTQGFDANGNGYFGDAGDFLPFLPGALENWEPASTESESGQTVLTGQHGVTEAVSPPIGSIKMYEPDEYGDYVLVSGEFVATTPGSGTHSRGFYHANADLAIIVNSDGSDWEAYSKDGTNLKPHLLAAGDVVTIDSIYDARQSTDTTKVPVIKLDIDRLNDSGVFPPNGLIYASHYGMGTGTDAKGLQVIDCEELEDALTLVTEGAVYIEGDFNTDDKKGAAVIGDAVNLLSNSWDGSKTQGALPTASNTTYNLAIITGNHDTEGSSYNGGFENLPRFHEKWSKKRCEINGSFVNTWVSEHATGTWSYGGDRYKAPKRDWSYDPMFNNVANLPPFTPMVVTAVDVVAW